MSGPKRGEIYYISIPYHTGTEMAKDRPGIIVSADKVNATYGHVMVCAVCQGVFEKIFWQGERGERGDYRGDREEREINKRTREKKTR